MSAPTTPSQAAPVAAPRFGGPAAAGATLAVLLVAVALGALATGATRPSLLLDAGPLVRWGLPLLAGVVDLAAACTLGGLVLCCVAWPVVRGQVWAPGLHLVTAGAAVWTLGELCAAVLAYADLSGLQPTAPGFGTQFLSFVAQVDLGRGYAVTVAVAALVTVGAVGVRSIGGTGLLLLLSLVGLVPSALAGHSSAAADHETAVTALGLHVLGVTVWVGGLLALAVLGPLLQRRARTAEALPADALPADALARAVARFSPVALWAYVAVLGSGVVTAAIRLDGPADLFTTAYGRIVLLKTLATAALGVLGLWQRRAALPGLAAGRTVVFVRLLAVELAVAAVAFGLGAALSRSAPPVADVAPAQPTPAEVVTGYPLPPAPTLTRWVTLWQPDLLWVVVVAVAAGAYVVGVVRLRRRGDAWPWGRTVSWLAGLAVLTWVTSGAPAAYGRVTFSAHMLGHMTLSMLVPLLLVPGAPLTLVLRATTARADGSRGVREWVLATVESRYLRLLTRAPVVAVLFAGTLVVFYYSPLLELALSTHVGHEIMHAHFLVAGYLMVWVLAGTDPGPGRPEPPMRLVMLFATMAFHAFFGVSLISGTEVLAQTYYTSVGRIGADGVPLWGLGLLDDQRYGGGIAWGVGDLPTLVLALMVAVQWSRTDAREARRSDRAADRDGDADLTAYNAMLAGLAAHDTRPDDA